MHARASNGRSADRVKPPAGMIYEHMQQHRTAQCGRSEWWASYFYMYSVTVKLFGLAAGRERTPRQAAVVPCAAALCCGPLHRHPNDQIGTHVLVWWGTGRVRQYQGRQSAREHHPRHRQLQGATSQNSRERKMPCCAARARAPEIFLRSSARIALARR